MSRQDQNAAGRAKYSKMWDLAASVIRTWDPWQLLAGGAPIDEYDKEISSLVAQIPRIHSAADASHAVLQIFSSSLEVESLPRDACSEVGKKFFAALSEQGLVD